MIGNGFPGVEETEVASSKGRIVDILSRVEFAVRPHSPGFENPEIRKK